MPLLLLRLVPIQVQDILQLFCLLPIATMRMQRLIQVLPRICVTVSMITVLQESTKELFQVASIQMQTTTTQRLLVRIMRLVLTVTSQPVTLLLLELEQALLLLVQPVQPSSWKNTTIQAWLERLHFQQQEQIN